MYFWNLNGLKEQWKRGAVSERHLFYYVLANGLVLSLWNLCEFYAKSFTQRGLPNPIPPASTGMFLSVFVGTALGIGIFSWLGFAYFRANGGDHGRNLLGKLVSIGFVLMLQCLPVLALLYFLFFAWESPPTLLLVVMFLGPLGLLCWLVVSMFRALREIRAGELAGTVPEPNSST